MSWSVNYVGTPEKIVEALEKQSEGMSAGQSKIEFDAAKPALIALVKENFNKKATPLLVRLEAWGSGYSEGGEQVQRQACVKLEAIQGQLLV